MSEATILRSTGPYPPIVVGGVPFQVSNPREAVEYCLNASISGQGVSIRLANAYCVALAHTTDSYNEVLGGPGVNFPDGAPVAFVMRRREKAPARSERVRGPSFFQSTLDASRGLPVRHYFLGSTPSTLALLLQKLEDDYPDVQVAGSFAPPFGPITEDFVWESARKVAASGANILWVGMGTPKQDYATARLAVELNMPCVGVGAAFDFLAGTTPEAPSWVQRSGFEWLFRFATEPRRLWRRYLFGNARFLMAVLKDTE